MDQTAPKPLIIAHRGASVCAPENTLAAFAKAVEHGADGIEFDVRLSKDGVPVVFHDASLKRIAGTDVRVSSINSADLALIDAGSWFSAGYTENGTEKFVSERIPTLVEAMDLLKGFTGTIYVELKGGDATISRLVNEVGQILAAYAKESRLIVKSFNLEAVSQISGFASEIQTAALFKPNILRLLRKETQLVRIASEMGFNRLSLHFSLATKKLMRLADSAGLPVTIWTVDSPRWIKRSVSLGIDSVITNDPEGQLAARKILFDS